MTTAPGSDNPKGDPRLISPTEGEDITPQNPEVIKQFPVDLTNKKEVERVERGIDQHGQPLGTTR